MIGYNCNVMDKGLHRLTSSDIKRLKARYQRSEDKYIALPFMPLMPPIPLLEAVLNISHCGAAIFEASNTNYMYISKSIEQMFGYKTDMFKEAGLEFLLSITHPDDREGLILILHKELDNLLYLNKDQCQHFFSSYDYRIKKNSGEYIRVLQRNQILQSDEQGKMLYMLNIINDVSHLKENKHMMLHIKLSAEIRNNYIYNLVNRIFTEVHFPSKRELQLLKLLGKGYSSKEIASLLSISVHTVETHRRNMLDKANVKDTSKLVSYALAAGIL